MTSRILIAFVTCSFLAVPAFAANETKVALAVSQTPTADQTDRELAGGLLSLLELNVSQLDKIAVVERLQIDKILQEIVINHTQGTEPTGQQQLGKLLTADLILSVQIRRLKQNNPQEETRFHAIATIVDTLTGTIRGRTIAKFRAVTVDEVTVQIARYLKSVIASPQQSGVTLAIGTFESLGRFERLRAVETGLRDLMTEQLQQMSDFRVVQRTEMRELNEEFRLMRSGLADATQLPDTLPNRSAAFLLQGTIDEQNRSGKRWIIVEAELIHAQSEQSVHQFRFETTPKKLPQELSQHLETLAKKLAAETKISPAEIRRPVKTIEATDLFQMARRDLERFARISPIDGSPQWFSLPGSPNKPEDRPPLVDADSPLGKHLLLKSIDRLESALYIDPELTEAAYSLGFCYSFHLPGIFQPERAAELLEQIYARDPEGERAIPALWLLSEINFTHDGKSRIPADPKRAFEQTVYAFEKMPAAGRTFRWTRLLEQISQLSPRADDPQVPLRVATVATQRTLECEGEVRDALARQVTRFSTSLLRDKRLGSNDRNKLQELLIQWTKVDASSLSTSAATALAEIASAEKNFERAANWYERAAAFSEAESGQKKTSLWESLMVRAARQQRLGGHPDVALKLLDRVDPSHQPQGHLYLYSMELGLTFEDLEQPGRALQTYIAAAETNRIIIPNTDIIARIKKLGGVTVREDSDVKVTYVPPPEKQPFLIQKLATDGRRLYCAGSAVRPPKVDLAIFDLTTREWSQANESFQGVTCLACNGGSLWVGTVNAGIWRYGPVDRSWTQWSTRNGLPDDRVVSLALDGQILYAGVGTASSGGMIKIDARNRITVLDSPGTPDFAPTHLAIDSEQILARTRAGIHRYDRKFDAWTVLEAVKSPKVFSGTTQTWASDLKMQLYPFQPDGTIDESCRKAWAPANGLGENYLVKFVIERGDQFWFGGTPTQRFRTTGLYRFDRSTGEFVMYGPRDGFRFDRTFTTYDAVWALDRLWVAGDGGLAEVEFLPKSP